MTPMRSFVTLRRPQVRGQGPAGGWVQPGPRSGGGERGAGRKPAGARIRSASCRPTRSSELVQRSVSTAGTTLMGPVPGRATSPYHKCHFLGAKLQRRRAETLQKAGLWARSPEDLEPRRWDKDDPGQDRALGQSRVPPVTPALGWWWSRAVGGPGAAESDHSLQERRSRRRDSPTLTPGGRLG